MHATVMAKNDDSLVKAWQILRTTVYNGQLIRDGAESVITGKANL